MCGLGGYNGIKSEAQRLLFAWSVGVGIDLRGGHGIGYATGTRIGRSMSDWSNVGIPFMSKVVKHDKPTMLHARYATCGNHTLRETHPFKIGNSLIGMHNGMLYNAEESAAENDRKFTVDSKELFELLASGDNLNNHTGYGVITWINFNQPHCVNICKLSDSGEICVASTAEGAMIWASTKKILRRAAKAAHLYIDKYFEIETGTIYSAFEDGLYISTGEKVRFQ